MAQSIMIFSIKALYNYTQHDNFLHDAECRILFTVMLDVLAPTQSVVVLNVVVTSVFDTSSSF
jgi:hypothetical protein